jgi:hypothetical protein
VWLDIEADIHISRADCGANRQMLARMPHAQRRHPPCKQDTIPMHTTPRHSTQAKEREDAARFAKVMEEATKEVLEREQLEHELELLDDDFDYCRKKLRSCADFLSAPLTSRAAATPPLLKTRSVLKLMSACVNNLPTACNPGGYFGISRGCKLACMLFVPHTPPVSEILIRTVL